MQIKVFWLEENPGGTDEYVWEKYSLDLSDPVALSYSTSYYGDETDDVLREGRCSMVNGFFFRGPGLILSTNVTPVPSYLMTPSGPQNTAFLFFSNLLIIYNNTTAVFRHTQEGIRSHHRWL